MEDGYFAGDAALFVEHEALKRRTLALSREHERLRADQSRRAELGAHRFHLQQNVVALEQHYLRLRELAARRGRERTGPD
jgi:hypothetical protein